MKKGIALAVGAVAVCAVIVQAGDLEPPGPPAPTGRSTIWQADMPVTISEPGSYVVMENLTGVAGVYGITIDSDDVTLDLNGFTLQGVPGSWSGIYVNPSDEDPEVRYNIVIRNGSVREWGSTGVWAEVARGGVLEDLHVYGNMNIGLYAASATARRITSYENGGDGIQMFNHGTVADCFVRENGGFGIETRESVVKGCVVHSNDGDGIRSYASSAIVDCVVRQSGGNGINADYSLIRGNISAGNTLVNITGISSTIIDNHDTP